MFVAESLGVSWCRSPVTAPLATQTSTSALTPRKRPDSQCKRWEVVKRSPALMLWSEASEPCCTRAESAFKAKQKRMRSEAFRAICRCRCNLRFDLFQVRQLQHGKCRRMRLRNDSQPTYPKRSKTIRVEETPFEPFEHQEMNSKKVRTAHPLEAYNHCEILRFQDVQCAPLLASSHEIFMISRHTILPFLGPTIWTRYKPCVNVYGICLNWTLMWSSDMLRTCFTYTTILKHRHAEEQRFIRFHQIHLLSIEGCSRIAMIARLSTERHLVQLKAVEAGAPGISGQRVLHVSQWKDCFATVPNPQAADSQIHSCTSHFALPTVPNLKSF